MLLFLYGRGWNTGDNGANKNYYFYIGEWYFMISSYSFTLDSHSHLIRISKDGEINNAWVDTAGGVL